MPLPFFGGPSAQAGIVREPSTLAALGILRPTPALSSRRKDTMLFLEPRMAYQGLFLHLPCGDRVVYRKRA